MYFAIGKKNFPCLNLKKNRAGNRIYSERDLEIVRAIKTMLREQKLSTKGTLEELYRMFDKPKKITAKTQQEKTKSKSEVIPKEQSLFGDSYENKIILREIRNSLKTILEIAKNL